MKVTQQICEVALLEIYAKKGCGPGEGFSMSDLEKAWRETGLRRSDLADALLGLMDLKQLTRDSTGTVGLTPHGYEQIASGKFREGSLGDYLRLKREMDQARNRRRGAPTTRLLRRVSDKAPPS